MADRPRVIVALSSPTERTCVADWLSAEGLEPVHFSSSREPTRNRTLSPFDLVIADHGLVINSGVRLLKGGARSPLTPMIVVGSEADRQSDAVDRHVMLLERPLDRATLLCYVWMALLEGRPVRRSPRKPLAQFEAVVNGVPVRLIDVSLEGVRLAMPSGQGLERSRTLHVRVPLRGVKVAVNRAWVRPTPGQDATIWYGGALVDNQPSAEQAWRWFVDSIPVPANTKN